MQFTHKRYCARLNSLVSDWTPKRAGQELHEWPTANQNSGLCSAHCHLFEVYSHKRKQWTEGREEEEVKCLCKKKLRFHAIEIFFDKIRPSSDFVSCLLRYRILVGVHLACHIRWQKYESMLDTTGHAVMSQGIASILLVNYYATILLF